MGSLSSRDGAGQGSASEFMAGVGLGSLGGRREPRGATWRRVSLPRELARHWAVAGRRGPARKWSGNGRAPFPAGLRLRGPEKGRHTAGGEDAAHGHRVSGPHKAADRPASVRSRTGGKTGPRAPPAESWGPGGGVGTTWPHGKGRGPGERPDLECAHSGHGESLWVLESRRSPTRQVGLSAAVGERRPQPRKLTPS